MMDKCQKLIELRFDKARLIIVSIHYLPLIGHLMAEFMSQDIISSDEPDRALRIFLLKIPPPKLAELIWMSVN